MGVEARAADERRRKGGGGGTFAYFWAQGCGVLRRARRVGHGGNSWCAHALLDVDAMRGALL